MSHPHTFIFISIFLSLSLLTFVDGNSHENESDRSDKIDETDDSARYTVSGLSSGGFQACQFQVAHSSSVMGAGIIAGGPYWCANFNLAIALSSCMKTPSLINVSELTSATYYAASTLTIDDPENLESHRVFVLGGTKDTVVDQGVGRKLVDYYNAMGVGHIDSVFDIGSEHCFPTNMTNLNPCDHLGSPYINECEYDTAFIMLSSIYTANLNPPIAANLSRLYKIDQKKYVPLHVDPKWCGLNDDAFMYVPAACEGRIGECRKHIAFHGCEQSYQLIGPDFMNSTGYNEVAESNEIVVLYPQATKNDLNPKSCWDWWGYTGADYATKLACQIMTVKKMADDAMK